MRARTILSLIFQGVQFLAILMFVLGTFGLLTIDYMTWFVIGIFLIFLNVLTWAIIIGDFTKKPRKN